MPARKFKRDTIRWRKCAHCFKDFPDSRKDRQYCKRSCKYAASRLRKRHGAIAAQGGKCKDCGKVFNPEYESQFYVLQDGTVVCGKDLSRRSAATYQSRKSQKGPQTG